jgi:hypothetical protein
MRKMVVAACILVALVVLVGYGYLRFSGLQSKGKEAEIKEVLKGIFISEDNYKKAFNKYTARLEQAGYRVTLPGFSVYGDKKDISADELKLLGEGQLPYINDQSFRILLRVESAGDPTEIWSVDDRNMVVRVYPAK